MRSSKLIVTILSVAVCGLFALSIGLQAQSSKTLKLSRATPIGDVAKFQGEFTERLNHEIGAGAAAKGNWIAGRRVWRNFVDYFLIHTESARVAKKDMVQLSDDQVKELGGLINHRFEEAISAKKTSALGEGQINNSFFTGKLINPEKVEK
jgi:hypothetical protein